MSLKHVANKLAATKWMQFSKEQRVTVPRGTEIGQSMGKPSGKLLSKQMSVDADNEDHPYNIPALQTLATGGANIHN